MSLGTRLHTNLIVHLSEDCSANVHYILRLQMLIGGLEMEKKERRVEGGKKTRNGIGRNLNCVLTRVCRPQRTCGTITALSFSLSQ